MRPILSGMVSAKRLDVPAKARDAFGEACLAVHKKNLSEAQQHLSEALRLYPEFPAAWVLLGQVQEEQDQAGLAEQSCTHARDSDSNYLPGYLCLARLAARRADWSRVAELTGQVIELHPVRAPGAYYYNSLAYFYLKQDAPAEKSALRAIEEGGHDQNAQVHWLLAKIYEGKGNRASEADQLREYLKLARHAPDAAAVRKILEQIESQPADTTSSNRQPPQNK